MSAPIEVTTRYVTTVDDLPSAWAFVMDHLDSLGDDPHIAIKPIWLRPLDFSGSDTDPWPRQFEVVVEGMVSHDTEDPA